MLQHQINHLPATTHGSSTPGHALWLAVPLVGLLVALLAPGHRR